MAFKAVATVGSISSPCPCGCGPRVNVSGNPTVLVNGKPIAVVGGYWNSHSCEDCSHPMIAAMGKPTVLVGGRPIMRIGDALSDGAIVASGAVGVMA